MQIMQQQKYEQKTIKMVFSNFTSIQNARIVAVLFLSHLDSYFPIKNKKIKSK